MASHYVHLMPEVAATGREPASGCDLFPVKREAMKKPPRRNRPRNRQDGSLARSRRHGENNNETFHDDDKENACGVSRCRVACTYGRTTSQRLVASPPTRSTNELIYQQCLGSVIASYLSPRRGQSGRQALRFFDTLTSPVDVTPVVAKPSRDDDDADDKSNVNTSVWLSDSIETSSGVDCTATSSPPEVRPGGDDVIEQVPADSSKLVALCDVSRISVMSSTSVQRDQLSSLGGLAGFDVGPSSAFHSTFNYPLHSTLRATSVRCPTPLPESPASPVRRGEPDVYRKNHHCRGPSRQRDLPPPTCRRCDDTTPLRRQHARICLEQRQPVVDRRRPSAGRFDHDDDEEDVLSASISLHATRGSLPDLSDLSDNEQRSRRRRRRRCGLNPAAVDVESRAHRRRVPTNCTHCRCQSARPYVRQSADQLTIFHSRHEESVHRVDRARSQTPSSLGRPSCSRYTPAATVRPSLQRPTGCLPHIRSHHTDAAVVVNTRRRVHRRGVDLGCGRRRLLSKKLKLFNNILCSARAADVTQLTNLGQV